jgi:hypothetical protein
LFEDIGIGASSFEFRISSFEFSRPCKSLDERNHWMRGGNSE